MTRAVLSLGSNMGDTRAHLVGAVRALRPHLRGVSSLYRTPPWGPVAQDDFLNLVAIVDAADIDAAGWLSRAHELERAAKRRRLIRWGPRTLDVDVIAVWARREAGRAPRAGGDATTDTADDDVPVLSDDPLLTLPHPRAAERAFVLLPWAEIDPAAQLPGRGAVADLLAGLDTAGIERVGRLDP